MLSPRLRAFAPQSLTSSRISGMVRKTMATVQQLRELALSLPETVEKSHFGQPDFRIGNKIFAGLKPKEGRGWLKLTPARQAALTTTQPDAYVAAEGAWGRSGWTYLILDQIAARELEALVKEAWSLLAPRTLTGGARKKAPKR
jgi:hypothetical protein